MACLQGSMTSFDLVYSVLLYVHTAPIYCTYSNSMCPILWRYLSGLLLNLLLCNISVQLLVLSAQDRLTTGL